MVDNLCVYEMVNIFADTLRDPLYLYVILRITYAEALRFFVDISKLLVNINDTLILQRVPVGSCTFTHNTGELPLNCTHDAVGTAYSFVYIYSGNFVLLF